MYVNTLEYNTLLSFFLQEGPLQHFSMITIRDQIMPHCICAQTFLASHSQNHRPHHVVSFPSIN